MNSGPHSSYDNLIGLPAAELEVRLRKIHRLPMTRDVAEYLLSTLALDFPGGAWRAVLEADPLLAVNALRLSVYSDSRDLSTGLGHLRETPEFRALLTSWCQVSVNPDAFWKRELTEFRRHSLLTALRSRALAAQVLPQLSQELYLTGLLHDLGKMFYLIHGNERSSAFLQDHSCDKPFWLQERDLFGSCHARWAGVLLYRWGVPEVIRLGVKYHHDPRELPQKAEEWSRAVYLVHLADYLDDETTGSLRCREQRRLDPRVWDVLELNPSIIEMVSSRVKEEFTVLWDKAFGEEKKFRN